MYKFNRLAFRIKVAPAVFQQVMDMMLCELDFVVTYLDDILMKNENPEEYKKNVFEVFRRIQDYGFKLKDEKCEFLCIRSNILDK